MSAPHQETLAERDESAKLREALTGITAVAEMLLEERGVNTPVELSLSGWVKTAREALS